jgi:hypothetical protein
MTRKPHPDTIGRFPPKETLPNHNDDVTRRTQVPGTAPSPGPLEPRVTVVRLTPTGTVSGGSGSSELVERVAYAAQLADLIGELLGAGPFESVEVSLSNGGCVVARQANGALVAAASADGNADLTMLRQRLAFPPERP